MSAPHQAILDALCRRAQYDPSTILARLPGPDGEPVTVARMAGALAAGEPWAREWAEDVTGAAVRMVVGRGPGEPVDLDAWRAEAGACAPLDAAATPAWTQAMHIDEPRAIVSANAMSLSLLALDLDGMAIFDRVEDARFAVEARTGWPRDAARVGVLCERVAALEARIATLSALVAAGDRMEAHAVRFADRCAVLEAALGEACDGWDAARKSATPPRRADAETIARLRALAAGGAPKGESR